MTCSRAAVEAHNAELAAASAAAGRRDHNRQLAAPPAAGSRSGTRRASKGGGGGGLCEAAAATAWAAREQRVLATARRLSASGPLPPACQNLKFALKSVVQQSQWLCATQVATPCPKVKPGFRERLPKDFFQGLFARQLQFFERLRFLSECDQITTGHRGHLRIVL